VLVLDRAAFPREKPCAEYLSPGVPDVLERLDTGINGLSATLDRLLVALEELDRDEVVVRIIATPQRPADGSALASEVLSTVRADGGADEDRAAAAARA
jgi:hypothetical protein